MTRGTITPAGGQKPRQPALLIRWRSSAKLAASRSRSSCHGDLESHCSRNSIQVAPACLLATIRMPGSSLMPSAAAPSSTYAMSASPVFRVRARVAASGMLRITRVYTLGTRRQ
jgi:hypothetical protein